jgi:hypothetical protein
MFASATPGDLSKRTLEADDKLAICDIYPLAKDPAYCPVDGAVTDGKAGCAMGGGGAPGRRWPLAVAGAAAALALGLLRRRPRAGRRR